MVSLFSVFDPVVLGFQVNWFVVFIVLFMFPLLFFVNGNVKGLWEKVVDMFVVIFKDVSVVNSLGAVMLSVGLLVYLFVNNGVSLFPFVFCGTSHLVVTFSVGMMMWLSCFIMGWVSSMKVSAGHMVPEGSPLVLAFFMVLVETVSHLIRPITLSVRLAANMMAGHLIIGLIASISLFTFSSFFLSVLFQSMMLVLEWAVALIQAFVFSILVVLYMMEYY